MYIERLWTVKEVMKHIGCGRSTVYDWVYKGIIPHMMLGNTLRFHKHEVLDWVENGRGKGERK